MTLATANTFHPLAYLDQSNVHSWVEDHYGISLVRT